MIVTMLSMFVKIYIKKPTLEGLNKLEKTSFELTRCSSFQTELACYSNDDLLILNC
jgi:hypothetical protein